MYQDKTQEVERLSTYKVFISYCACLYRGSTPNFDVLTV